jgi:hypothetical protein
MAEWRNGGWQMADGMMAGQAETANTNSLHHHHPNPSGTTPPLPTGAVLPAPVDPLRWGECDLSRFSRRPHNGELGESRLGKID